MKWIKSNIHTVTSICNNIRPNVTTPEEFENGGFTLKTHQMFSAHMKTQAGVFKFPWFVFEKLRFRFGLVWTVGLTVERKLCFRDGSVWTVDLTADIKLRFFFDGLVWTAGLTTEIKLRFRDELGWTVGLTEETEKNALHFVFNALKAKWKILSAEGSCTLYHL